jgi:3(or 17)beta-hydroxysteroid dehydrogenase
MGRLEKRVALVTGGASGLGKAIALRLAADRATVVITDIQQDLGRVTAHEGGFTFIKQDVSDEAEWAAVIRAIEERFGGLHILVNNAGIAGPSGQTSPETTPLALWKAIFAINVEGVFLGCRAAIPAMRKSGAGSIINISSIAGLLATPYNTAYGASKAAVRQLTKSVAQHCAEQGLDIRCNSVHPGALHTPFWDKLAEEKARASGVSTAHILAEVEAESPMGGFTHVEDVAAAVSFLASDEARRITGTKMVIDGGLVDCDTYHLFQRKRQ